MKNLRAVACGVLLLGLLGACGKGGGGTGGGTGGSNDGGGSGGSGGGSGGSGTVSANGTYSDDGPSAGVNADITNARVTCVSVPAAEGDTHTLNFGFALNPAVGTPTLTHYTGPPGTSSSMGVVGSVIVHFTGDPAVGTYTFANLKGASACFSHYYVDDGGTSSQFAYFDFQSNSAGFDCSGPDTSTLQHGTFSLNLTSVALTSGGGLCTAHGSVSATLDIQDDPFDPTATGTLAATF